MDTFGDRLRTEREDRGLSLRDVAEILRVDRDLLRALERNDFEALPHEAAMMECLHGYAKCLEVDADLMIEDYVRERDGYLRGLGDAGVQPVAARAGAAVATGARPRRRLSAWLVTLAVAMIAVLAGWWMLSRDAATTPPEAPVAAAPEKPPLADAAPTPVEVAPTPLEVAPTPAQVARTPAEAPPTRAAIAPTPAAPPAARSAPTAPAPSSLRVTEHGVGTAVENRQLAGRSDRFGEGAQVWFWNLVEGGARGDRMDHVWLREGVEEMRVSLEIGGSSWRTFSTKTLGAGAAGSWAVEARDQAGRVLARSEFACVR